MSQISSGSWLLVDETSVEGLGHCELSQSSSCLSEFQAVLVLNSYESNCLRDWLSQRWLAKSLEQTEILERGNSRLVISKYMSAINLLEAKEKLEVWLNAVQSDRISAAQSRR